MLRALLVQNFEGDVFPLSQIVIGESKANLQRGIVGERLAKELGRVVYFSRLHQFYDFIAQARRVFVTAEPYASGLKIWVSW